jgi:hypothetical protein
MLAGSGVGAVTAPPKAIDDNTIADMMARKMRFTFILQEVANLKNGNTKARCGEVHSSPHGSGLVLFTAG